MTSHFYRGSKQFKSFLWLLTAWASLFGNDALAQSMYKCQRDGATYYADRPCHAANSEAVQIPSPAMHAPGSAKGKMDDLGRYLSGPCANLYYRMRQKKSQSYADREAAEGHYEYACSDEDSMARSRMQEVLSTEQFAQFQAEEAKEIKRREAERKSLQCKEMARIYKNRLLQAPHMTSGEQRDFTRFKENFDQRCHNGLK